MSCKHTYIKVFLSHAAKIGRYGSFLLLPSLIICWAFRVDAFSLEPEHSSGSYLYGDVASIASGEDITSLINRGGQLYFWNASTGLWIGNQNTEFEGVAEIRISDDQWFPGTAYYIVPVIPNDTDCDSNSTFSVCIESDDYLNTGMEYLTLYNDEDPPDSNVAPETTTNSVTSSYNSYPPQIYILSPVKGTVFAQTGLISYAASDQNDSGTEHEKSAAGLIDKPVRLYYSDKLEEWYGPVNPEFKVEIASELSARGSFEWLTTGLNPGSLYRIIVNALDKEGLIGEAFSELFAIDLSAPTFTIKADPPAVRSGKVTISVESSEDLSAPPDLYVAQNGAPSRLVPAKGSGKYYEATYAVVSGFDGTARILAVGKDRAGNTGSTTLSGGTFSVGVNPPPSPSIEYPKRNTSFKEDSIDIKGTVRADTNVFLLVNGKEAGNTVPDASGIFMFSRILLDTKAPAGKNVLSVISRDASGTESIPTVVEVKRNIAPIISISEPSNHETVGDQTQITTQTSDQNGDMLTYSYEIQKGKAVSDAPWLSIGKDLSSGGIIWNATEVEDGDYVLRVIVDDGIAQATSSPIHILVRNTLPFFRFDNGRKTTAKETALTLYGTAISSKSSADRPTIESVEYSLDKGRTYTAVKLTGTGTVYERRFFVEFPPFKEGTYPIYWRTKDSRGRTGTGVHVILVDKTSPKAPIIDSPRAGKTLSNEDDVDVQKSGLNLTITGRAEASSSVFLTVDSVTQKTKTSPLGRFLFDEVALFSKGKNLISLYVVDEAGNKSPSTDMSLLYNNAPEIRVKNPRPFHGFSGKGVISWSISDADGDSIRDVSVSYRRAGGFYKTLSSNAAVEGEISFDTAQLPEGDDYELRITASDGITPVTSITSFSIDTSSPYVRSFSVNRTSINSQGVIGSGFVRDDISGIDAVEYSISSDELATEDVWYKAIITRGFGQKDAAFTIRHPEALADGIYSVSVRAIDSADNASSPLTRSISIDETAPRVGSYFIMLNGSRITADEEGAISIPKDQETLFGISLESDARRASLALNGERINLLKNVSTGLWMAKLPSLLESVSIFISVDDGKNSVVDKHLASIAVVEKGSVLSQDEMPVSDVVISVLKFDEGSKRYKPLFGPEGELRSVAVDPDGAYDLALDEGSYRLLARSKGYATEERDIHLDRPSYVSEVFSLKKSSAFFSWIRKTVIYLKYGI